MLKIAGGGSHSFLFVFLFLFVVSGCAPHVAQTPILATIPLGDVTWKENVPVLRLRGNPYELGYQHGTILRQQVRASVANMESFVNRQVHIPFVGSWLARRTLARAWKQMVPFVSDDFLEEMRGLSDGAGIPLETLHRIHALPEWMAMTCASFAVFGKASEGGRLIHGRNLDWSIQSGVQRYAAVFVVHPTRGHPFVNCGWLGFIGVVSGINDQGISVSEIGAESADSSLKGTPMPFLLRRVLQESNNLDQTVELIRTAQRTGGYNYLFGDAKKCQAVVLETTRNHAALFKADQSSSDPYAVNLSDALFRADWALDPAIREAQKAACGNPSRPGLEPPIGSSSYEVRYVGQGRLLTQFYGKIQPEIAMAVLRAIVPSSNIQSVVYAYPEMWLATARGRQPAATNKYIYFDLEELFGEKKY